MACVQYSIVVKILLAILLLLYQLMIMDYDTALLPGVFFFRFRLIVYRLEKFFFSVNNDVGSNEY